MNRYHYNLGLYFNEVAQNNALKTSLRYPGKNFSYAELNLWTGKLANFLLEQDITQGDVIAIGHTKQPLSYALMLACLRLGITYVNLDVSSPTERNTQVLNICKARLLFCDSLDCFQPMSELAKIHGCKILILDEEKLQEAKECGIEKQKELMSRVDGATIAYVMFTSGSTGIPKGVAISHQSVLHFIDWGKNRFAIDDHDIFANLSPMYFDNSVFDFYTGLFSGASLAPIPRELLTKPYELTTYIRDRHCTIWFSVPSLLIYLNTMKAISSDSLPSLRCIIFGGEGYPKTELKKLYDSFSQQATLVNVYGPTECTCICSSQTLGDDDFREMEGIPTLGTLNPNFDYKIIDEENKESPTGELCLIGPQLAAGYFNDTTRTNISFETLHESRRYMKRMYRTGDLVRRISGKFYFMGRKDNQIKHMGYRIELEEIETSLHTLPHIIQSAVIYQRLNISFGKIICYVKADAQFDKKEAMQRLAEKLPEYMLPSKIVLIDELPRNPNGKIDRKALARLIDT